MGVGHGQGRQRRSLGRSSVRKGRGERVQLAGGAGARRWVRQGKDRDGSWDLVSWRSLGTSRRAWHRSPIRIKAIENVRWETGPCCSDVSGREFFWRLTWGRAVAARAVGSREFDDLNH